MEDKKGFTLSLALVDALPVIFFSVTAILIALDFKNTLFLIGAIVVALAGLLKVSWKLVLAIFKKDINLLNKQMRFTMPIGFLMIVISIVANFKSIDFSLLFQKIISLPSLMFFIVGLIGIITMSVLAFKLDSSKSKSNWIEQIVNSIAQFSIMLGVIFI